MAQGPDPPEYLTVLGHIADINSRISPADLPIFSSELLQAGLITYDTHTDAIANTGLGPRHKIASLTAVAMAAIKMKPGMFDSFVNIIETRADKEIAYILRSDVQRRGAADATSIGVRLTSTSDDDSLTVHVYVDRIKRAYQTPPTTWLPLPVSKHIKLVMFKEKGTRYGRDTDELTRHRVKGEVEQVMARKAHALVDIDSIFDEGTFENARRPLVILVEGALGSGKTTLAHHYCHEWANGNLAMFDLVALVYLRHPAVHSAESSISLDELLLVASGNGDEIDIVKKVAENVTGGLKFLLILEGWDEAPACLRAPTDPKYPSDNSFLGKLFRSVSSNTTILITSRPDSSIDLHKRPYVNRAEILGFTKESIHEYFHEALSTQLSSNEVTVECSKLKEHFSKYPAIESSCYLPLNAAILTLVYLDRNRTLPTTQHELFCELLLCCIDREVNTRQPDQMLESISSLDDLPHDLKEHLTNISILAYEGIMQNKVVFSQHEVSSLLAQPVQQDLPTMGVLQKVQWAGIRRKTMSYSFSHLSIQELLAAYHIFKLKEIMQVRVFQTLLGNPRFSTVLQFYAAFSKLTNQGVKEIISGRNFTKDRSSKLLLLSYMRCFYEAQVIDELLYRQIVLRMNGELNLSDIFLSPLDCMSVGYFMAFGLRYQELRVNLSVCRLTDHLFSLLVEELSKYAEAKNALHGVTELKMHASEICKAHVATVLQTNTTIKTLDISNCRISVEGVESLARALTVNRSLEELNFSGNYEIGDSIAYIATALQTNTTLRTLDISSCNISYEGVESLARALIANRSLEELNVRSNKIGVSIAYISTALQTNNTLRTLDISNCRISNVGVESLARALAVNKLLLELKISSNNRIDNNGIANIATALQTNTALRKLDISQCSISDEGVESLAGALAVNKSLQELDISDNMICDNGIAHIITVLQTNTTITKLTILISSDKVESLARALAINRTLQELNISICETGDNSLAHIATVLQKNCTMRTLGFSTFRVNDNTGAESISVCMHRQYEDYDWEEGWKDDFIAYDMRIMGTKPGMITISDERAKSLASALAFNKSLQELDISKNIIGHLAIAHITTALKTNSTLKKLKILVPDFSLIDKTSTTATHYTKCSLQVKWEPPTHSDSTTANDAECTNSMLQQLILKWFQQLGIDLLLHVQSLKENFLLAVNLQISKLVTNSELLQSLEAAAAAIAAANNSKGSFDIDIKWLSTATISMK